MTDDYDWPRLARYFAGECTPEEAEEVRHWIDADPARRGMVAEMRAAWDAAAVPSTTWDTPASWERIAARLRARERNPRLAAVRPMWEDLRPSRRSRGRRWVAAAAVVALIGSGAVVVWRELAMPLGRPVATAAPLREVRTPAGQRAELRLADGSRVMLGPQSVLRYDTASFGRSTRELRLEGQAYFEVTHDPRRPFLVHTERTVTEDLGTEFVITDYPGDAATEVVVASGTVAVQSPAAADGQPATVLTRGELVRLDTAGRPAVRRGVDLAAQLAWTRGQLVFAETPAAEVAARLSRWYGRDIRLGDRRLATQRFTASYTSEPDTAVVREFATAIGAHVTRRRGVILLVAPSNLR